jgi:hypothetical protein
LLINLLYRSSKQNQIIAALSSTGELVFIDSVQAVFVGQLKGQHMFRSFCLSPDGFIMSLVLMDAKYSLRVIRLDHILSISKPPQEADDVTVESFENSQAQDTNIIPVSPPKKVQLSIAHIPSFAELVDSKQESEILNRRKLLRFLKHYGTYPDNFRQLIWRFLLRVPENREAYEALMEKGPHPSGKDFRKKLPIKSDRLAKSLERVLAALAHWSQIFEELDYLPGLVFPLVKVFANDMFSGFEVVMTIIINWCQKWWEYYPNPPIECLNVLEDLLAYHDKELYAHFNRLKVTSQVSFFSSPKYLVTFLKVYGWSMMQSLFTELFSKSEWLKLWDHLVTNPPAFMYYFITAYIRASRTALLNTNKRQDVIVSSILTIFGFALTRL